MQNFKIEGLPFPMNDKDAATKVYADALVEDRRQRMEANNPFTFQNDVYTAKGKIDLQGFKIENVANPENPKDVVNLEYFKTNTSHAFVRKNGGFEAQEAIYLRNKKLGGLKDPVQDREAAHKKYVDEEIEKWKDFCEEKTADIVAAGGNVDAAALDAVKTDLEKNQAFNTRNRKTFNARGNINMKQKTLRNLPEPEEETDATTKGYVDEMKEFFEEKIKELGKPEEVKENRDMKGFKIVNVGDAVNPGDVVNKKYVDEEVAKIADDPALLRRNGGFLSLDAIDMNTNCIKNIGRAQENTDAVSKLYVDEEVKKGGENLLNMALFSHSHSTILIRGELEGPIIGIDEVENANRRIPSTNGGLISVDEKGTPILPSIVYFGKHDGGEVAYNAQGKIKIKPSYIFPFPGAIVKTSAIFMYDDGNEKEENFKVVCRITEGDDGEVRPGEKENTDLSKGIVEGKGRKKEYEYNWKKKTSGKVVHHCDKPGEIEKNKFNECSSLIVYFKSSHPQVKRCVLTFAVQLFNFINVKEFLEAVKNFSKD